MNQKYFRKVYLFLILLFILSNCISIEYKGEIVTINVVGTIGLCGTVMLLLLSLIS